MRRCACFLTGPVAQKGAWQQVIVWSYVAMVAAEATAVNMVKHPRHRTEDREDNCSTSLGKFVRHHALHQDVFSNPAVLVAIPMHNPRFNVVLQVPHLSHAEENLRWAEPPCVLAPLVTMRHATSGHTATPRHPGSGSNSNSTQGHIYTVANADAHGIVHWTKQYRSHASSWAVERHPTL